MATQQDTAAPTAPFHPDAERVELAIRLINDATRMGSALSAIYVADDVVESLETYRDAVRALASRLQKLTIEACMMLGDPIETVDEAREVLNG